MTNFSDSSAPKAASIGSKLAQQNKQPLIPPARIRSSSRTSGQQQQHQVGEGFIMKSKTNNNNNNNNNNTTEAAGPGVGQEIWSSAEDLFWDHMNEVQNKWSTLKLNDDIWAKLIYFEQNCRLAKAYVSAPILTIDGSANGLDGFRIGLSGIDNNYRSLESIRCLRSIGPGIKLKIDNQGNILIRKVGGGGSQQQQQHAGASSIKASNPTSTPARQCSVWVKDWPQNNLSESTDILSDTCMMREIERTDISYKLFDMRKFRLQLERRRLENDHSIDWRQCVSIISFVQQAEPLRSSNTNGDNLLEDPCWLMIINIIAIDMLKSSVRDMSPIGLSGAKQQLNGTHSILHHHHSLLMGANNLAPPPPPASSASSATAATHHNRNHHLSLQNTSHSGSDRPLRTSLSASILAPSSSATNRATSSSGTESSVNHSAAGEERIKKLRTSSRLKLSTPMNNKLTGLPASSFQSQYRRYQSTQQLSSLSSASNTIYTTFNSKFINSHRNKSTTMQESNIKHPLLSVHHDNSLATSDYNSAPRSSASASNYWRQQQQLYSPYDSSTTSTTFNRQHHTSRHRGSEERKLLVEEVDESEQGKLVPPHYSLGRSREITLEPKSFSLSTVDLTQQQQQQLHYFMPHRRLNLRSSIKMNYDHEVVELDDEFDSVAGSRNHHNHRLKSSSHYHNGQFFLATAKTGANNRRGSSVALASLNNRVTSDPKLVGSVSDFETGAGCGSNLHISCCCDLANEVNCTKLSTTGSRSHVNHNECRATQGSAGDLTKAQSKDSENDPVQGKLKQHEQQQKQQKQPPQQKVSRSSIDSSSSSSGCADNDYFMSHSSSSMSSSTASNERELFSQPASSSGIVCSGNTSDEYDEGARKANSSSSSSGNGSKPEDHVDEDLDHLDGLAKATAAHNSTPGIKQTDGAGALCFHKHAGNKSTKVGANKSTGTTNHSHDRRGYKIKTIEGCCCDQAAHLAQRRQLVSGADFDQCDCPSVELCCDYCCQCPSSPSPPTTLIESGSSQPCTCHQDDDQESIYNRLPHEVQISTSSQSIAVSKLARAGGKENSDRLQRSGSEARLSSSSGASSSSASPLSAKKVNDEDDFENISTIPMHETGGQKEFTKSSKQGNGWLEKRKYSKILPKFMFASSNNNRQQRVSEQQSGERSTRGKGSSSTMDKNEKYRPIKSTQDLS